MFYLKTTFKNHLNQIIGPDVNNYKKKSFNIIFYYDIGIVTTIVDGKCIHLSLVSVLRNIRRTCTDRCTLAIEKSEMKTKIDEVAKEHGK